MRERRANKILPFLVVILLSFSAFLPIVFAESVHIEWYNFSTASTVLDLKGGYGDTGLVNVQAGQTFNPDNTGYVTNVTVRLRKTGSPIGNVTCIIRNATAVDNMANTAILANSTDTIDLVSEMTTLSANYTFTFDGTLQLSTGTIYWVGVTSYDETNIDNANFYSMSYNGLSPTHEGYMMNFYNSAWSGSSDDFVFDINGDTETEPEPTPTPDNDDWYDNANMAQIASYVVILALIFIPVGILAKTANFGFVGAVIGLAIGTGLSYLLFPELVPIWLVFLVALGIVALLYKSVGR